MGEVMRRLPVVEGLVAVLDRCGEGRDEGRGKKDVEGGYGLYDVGRGFPGGHVSTVSYNSYAWIGWNRLLLRMRGGRVLESLHGRRRVDIGWRRHDGTGGSLGFYRPGEGKHEGSSQMIMDGAWGGRRRRIAKLSSAALLRR